MKQLRGEHTFWPWVKTNPPLREIERTLAKEMTRPYPRPRIVRWCAHVILLPVYVTAADMGFMFFNGLARAFGAEPMFNVGLPPSRVIACATCIS